LDAWTAPKPYELIRFGAMDGPKPYRFIRFGRMIPKPYEIYKVWSHGWLQKQYVIYKACSHGWPPNHINSTRFENMDGPENLTTL